MPPTTSIVNGGLKLGFKPDYGLYVAAAGNIGNPRRKPSRTIPWNSSTGLAPGSTTDARLNKSGEIFIGNFVKKGSGEFAGVPGRSERLRRRRWRRVERR